MTTNDPFGDLRRRPREQRYRRHRKRATVSMPWLCSARPLPTIASALQLEHRLRAQSRQEHHARRPSRATAMRPGAIVPVRARFDVQRRLSAQIPTVPLCAEIEQAPEVVPGFVEVCGDGGPSGSSALGGSVAGDRARSKEEPP